MRLDLKPRNLLRQLLLHWPPLRQLRVVRTWSFSFST